MKDYSKYINSTGTHYISNSGSDENGTYSGGKAGDQSGTEWYLRSWYNRPWNCVLRYPDETVALLIAELGCAAALNDHIGYDQNQRDTYWTQLKAVGYNPEDITVDCEEDCSSGVIANVKAAGYLRGISALQNISATYTGNMRSAFQSAGFEVLTADKYLSGYTYLKPGDILLNDSHHTCTNVTKGANASFSATSGGLSGSTSSTGSTGDTGTSGGTTTATAIDPADLFDSSLAGTYTVTASSLNLRSGHSTSKTVVAVIPNGGKVQCYGYYSKESGENWLLVEYVVNNVTYTGHVCATYLSGGSTTSSSGGTASSTPLYTIQVTVDNLNIRSGAGTNYSVVGQTGKGCFGITEEKTGQVDNGTGTWGKLLSGAGWVWLGAEHVKKI